MEHNPPDLNQASLQEIFDYGVNYLRQQGAKACVVLEYRNNDGTLTPKEHDRYRIEQPDGRIFRCGAGCFLPDDRYSPKIEGIRVISHRNRFFNYEPAGMKMDLLMALQDAHDKFPIEQWESQWQFIACNFGLTYTERT